MASPEERRTDRRLIIRLPIECMASCGGRRVTYRTVTHDISSGGVCFEADGEEFPIGASVEMELSVPPSGGHSPYPGRVRGMGEVVRVDRLGTGEPEPRFRIAAEFAKPLKLFF